jgi:hypothetical protein
MTDTTNTPTEAPSAPAQAPTYGSDHDSLKEAAAELTTRREETSTPDSGPPEAIGYPNGLARDEDDKEIPLKARKASEDLARYRRAKEEDAAALDRALNPERYEAEESIEPTAEEREAHPILGEYEQQLARQEELAAKDAELKAANERLKVAFDETKSTADQSELEHQAAQRLAAQEWGVYFPEIQGGYQGLVEARARDPAAFDNAMQQFARDEPEKFEKLNHLVIGTEAFLNHTAQQSQAAQQVHERQRQAWVMEQDMTFARAHPETMDPNVGPKLRQAALDVLRSTGMSEEQIKHEWNGGLLRSAAAQEIVLQAAKFHLAKSAPALPKSIPPVTQRPGVSSGRNMERETNIKNLDRKLDETGSLRTAARLLQARRSARR